MRTKAFCTVCVALLVIMTASALSYAVSCAVGVNPFCPFLSHNHSSMSESGIPNEPSLGAVSLPGYRITEDYTLDVLVRNQQYNLKSVIMLLIVSVLLIILRTVFSQRRFKDIRKFYRLLI